MTIQEGGDASEATVFRAHALPQGACENLVCALAPLAHLQAGGHNLVDAIFEVLHEHGRLETTNELRRFIEKDSREAVNNCDLEKTLESLLVVKHTLTADFLCSAGA